MKWLLNIGVKGCFWGALLSAIAAFPANSAFGAVVTDGSLGAQATLNGPDYDVTEDLGQIRGSNLFHSFLEFGLNSGESATFSGPAAVENIIGRVTGGNVSQIDGTLRSTIQGADLFLLNPAGIMFGPNAALDISGAFHASTADYLRFENEEVFHSSATPSSVLSVSRPEAFGFLNADPAAIRVVDSQLEVPDGESITLTGGDILVNGRTQSAGLTAPAGRIQLTGVGAAGEVSLEAPSVLSAPEAQSGHVTLSNADISTEGEAAGSVVIRGGRIQINRGTNMKSDNHGSVDAATYGLDLEAATLIDISGESILSSYSNGAGRGGDIRIKTGDLRLREASHIYPGFFDAGDSGDLRIETDRLRIVGEASIFSFGLGDGSGGSVTIDANESVELDGADDMFDISTQIGTVEGDINISAPLLKIINFASVSITPMEAVESGNLRIDADFIYLNNGHIGTSSFNQGGKSSDVTINAGRFEAYNFSLLSTKAISGDSGAINITADTLLWDGMGYTETGIAGIRSDNGGSGKGGDITISTNHIDLKNGAGIVTAANGESASGRVRITTDDLTISGFSKEIFSGIFTNSFGSGAAGDIDIEVSGALNLMNDVRISSSIEGSGDGGNIKVSAADLLMGNGSYIRSTSLTGGTGDSGDINLEISGTLKLMNDALINAETDGIGDAGDIRVAATELWIENDAYITSASGIGGAGNGGNIIIACSGDVRVDKGKIVTAVFGDGTGGDIHINASNLLLRNQALISARSEGGGNAGGITLELGELLGMDDAKIGLESLQADGGDIQITAGKLIHLADSEITTSVIGGQNTGGGNFDLQAPFVVLDDSLLTATALEGSGGNIDIGSEVFLATQESVLDASSQLGIDGRVDIQAPLYDLSGTLKPLPNDFLDAAELSRTPCETRVMGGDYGSFVVRGHKVSPVEPGTPIMSPPLDLN